MPKTLLQVEHIRALATIQPHACPHAVVDLANDGEHSRWNAKASQDSPQERAIDGVIGFGKVDIHDHMTTDCIIVHSNA